MTQSLRQRREAIRRKRRRLPPAPPAEDGIWLTDPDRGVQTFVPFDLLHEMCEYMMCPDNASFVEEDLGKMNWRDDPTYNLRRKR